MRSGEGEAATSLPWGPRQMASPLMVWVSSPGRQKDRTCSGARSCTATSSCFTGDDSRARRTPDAAVSRHPAPAEVMQKGPPRRRERSPQQTWSYRYLADTTHRVTPRWGGVTSDEWSVWCYFFPPVAAVAITKEYGQMVFMSRSSDGNHGIEVHCRQMKYAVDFR